jgi:prepilin-type N-terminal cleavage/methylation domain-containing protein
MQTAAMRRRSGVTLIEVLVAIFVMAIGLMALLTLFPLGALEMAQAIKDQRAYDSGYNAASEAEAFWKRSVEIAIQNNQLSPDPMVDQAMLNPSLMPANTNGGSLPDRTGLAAPSYPAYLDPFGSFEYTGNAQKWIAAIPGLMPRTNTTLIANNPSLTLPHYSNLDDITFDNDTLNTAQYGPTGTPRLLSPAPALFQRDNRYSWALVIQRQDCSISATNTFNSNYVNLTVVVYSGRSLALSNTLGITGENAYAAVFQGGSRDATITGNGQKPDIRRGAWILDAQMVDPTNPQFVPHAYFYRVVNVSDQGSNGSNSIDVELQTPALASSPNGGGNPAVVMDTVVEVFVKNSMHP